MELVSCHNSMLLGYTEIAGPVLLLSNDSQVLVVLVGIRVTMLDRAESCTIWWRSNCMYYYYFKVTK